MGKKGSQALRLHKQRQKKVEAERQEKADRHVKRYKELVEKRGQELQPLVSASEKGLVAYLVPVDTKTGDKLTEKEQKAFREEYDVIVKEEGIEWFAELHYAPREIKPRLRLREYVEPPVMNWPEAQRQNLETRKECEHSETPDKKQCELCGLEQSNWGAEGKGVTEEYEARKSKEIEEALAKENSK